MSQSLHAKILHVDGKCYRSLTSKEYVMRILGHADQAAELDPMGNENAFDAAQAAYHPQIPSNEHKSEANAPAQAVLEDAPPGFARPPSHVAIPQPASQSRQQTGRELKKRSNESMAEFEAEAIKNADAWPYKASLQLDPEVLGFVIGTKGATKQRLEEETGTKISIAGNSRKVSMEDNVHVIAQSDAQLQLGMQALQKVLSDALASNRLPVNYFISIPVNTDAVQDQFRQLQDQILSLPGAAEAKIDETIFISPKKLHLTLLVLKLYSNESRAKAAKVMKSLRSTLNQLLGHKPISLELQGLKAMNSRTSNADVLYIDCQNVRDATSAEAGQRQGNIQAQQGGLDQLHLVCEEVGKAFAAADLVQERDLREPLLHVTIMNTKYRKVKGSPGSEDSDTEAVKGKPMLSKRRRFQKRVQFDATEVLQKLGDTSFGNVSIQRLELSQMSAVDSTGYYACLEQVMFPAV